MNKILILIFVLFFTGCGMIKYEDVSYKKEYSQIIGKIYKASVPLVVYGSTKDINHYETINKDDFNGTKIIVNMVKKRGSKVEVNGIIEIGTIFKIIKVKSCINCFGSRIEFIVKGSFDVFKNIPVKLDNLTIKDKENNLIMNPKIIEECPVAPSNHPHP